METLSFKTKSANKAAFKKSWFVIDAQGLVVGRLASKVAHILRGKNRPYYTPHADTGDYVIVLNADKVRFSGDKLNSKEYITYSGYPGGQKRMAPKEALAKKPTLIMENAVRGMLPKNKLGRAMFKKLFVYTGTEHPHQAQQPEQIKL